MPADFKKIRENHDTCNMVFNLLKQKHKQTKTDLAYSLRMTEEFLGPILNDLKALGVPLTLSGEMVVLYAQCEFLNSVLIKEKFRLFNIDQDLEVEVINIVDSTNNVLISSKFNSSKIRVCLAELQTAGRGRRGKFWQSPCGANIYMSLKWRFNPKKLIPNGLSLALGVAIHEALIDLGIEDVKVKWPNDIMVNKMKIAGILIEVVADTSKYSDAIIGVGLNFDMSRQLGSSIDQPWTDICSHLSKKIGRNDVAGILIAYIIQALKTFEREGFHPFFSIWDKCDFLKGKTGKVVKSDGQSNVKFEGISTDGALIVVNDSKERQLIHSGEVSLKIE